MRRMIAMRRKTLVVCKTCHNAIHAGKPYETQNGKDRRRAGYAETCTPGSGEG